MTVYIKKNNNLLIVPCKCGSKFAETVCHKHVVKYKKAQLLMPEIMSGNITITAVKRDPVTWYFSGYYHVLNNIDWFPVDPLSWTPKKHWKFALQRKLGQNQGDDVWKTEFDQHCWIDPWNQVYQSKYKSCAQVLPLPLDVPVHWVDLNSEEFVDVIHNFKAKKTEVHKPINVSNKMHPRLTPRLEKLLMQLDDWSWRLGYDIQKSIHEYRQSYG